MDGQQNNAHDANHCDKWIAPSAQEFFSEMSNYRVGCLSVACCFVLMVVLLFFLHISVLASAPLKTRAAHRIGFLLALFPVSACSSFVALCFPRAVPMVNVVIHIYYARCLFLFVEVVADDLFGDRERMKRQVGHSGKMAKFDVPPVACCLTCLPEITPSGRVLHRLEWLIWQNGVVRTLLSFAIGVIETNRIGRPVPGTPSPLTYLAVAGILSTLTAVFALNVYADIVATPLQEYRARLKFRFVQALVMIFNLQGNIFILLGSTFKLIECTDKLSGPVHSQHLQHQLLIGEMALVSVAISVLFRGKHNLLLRKSHTQRITKVKTPMRTLSDQLDRARYQPNRRNTATSGGSSETMYSVASSLDMPQSKSSSVEFISSESDPHVEAASSCVAASAVTCVKHATQVTQHSLATQTLSGADKDWTAGDNDALSGRFASVSQPDFIEAV